MLGPRPTHSRWCAYYPCYRRHRELPQLVILCLLPQASHDVCAAHTPSKRRPVETTPKQRVLDSLTISGQYLMQCSQAFRDLESSLRHLFMTKKRLTVASSPSGRSIRPRRSRRLDLFIVHLPNPTTVVGLDDL